jgi:glycerophosphoryl diester phosphodiesterase
VTNPWLERRVLNYAHQGGAREGPSSTLHAMRRAVAVGAHALELDVHATADRQLVVCHDSTVDRTTDGSGRISDLRLEEVQQLDNAYWWLPGAVAHHGAADDAYPLRGRAPQDPDLRIPTLREVLVAFSDTFLNLDVKETAPHVQPYEGLVIDLLRELSRLDDVIIASFHDAALEAVSALAPDMATAAGRKATEEFYFAFRNGETPPSLPSRALQVPPRHEDIAVVDEQFVEAAHRAGLAVHVWTIDEEEEMERLLDLGVDGIMTDRPQVLAGVLRSRGVAFGGAAGG